MSKNVLIISGSPRAEGNSALLCGEFKKGAEEAGHHTETVYLGGVNIGYCIDCGVCQKTGKCFQDDGMTEILDKMIKADTVVIGTPVYFYSMAGQVKTFIDRTLPRYTEIRNKAFYFILTAAVPDKNALERTLEGLRGFTACLGGAKERGVLYGTGVYQAGEVKGTKHMKDAFEMGRNI